MQLPNGALSCRFNWASPSMSATDRIFYRTLIINIRLSVGLVIPFVCICASYFLLVVHLQEIARARRKRNTISGSISYSHPSRRRITGPALLFRCRMDPMTTTAIVIVVTFVIFQLPHYVMEEVGLQIEKNSVYHDIKPTIHDALMYSYVNAVAQILVFVSSCCNPIFYGLLNKNYSKYIVQYHLPRNEMQYTSIYV